MEGVAEFLGNRIRLNEQVALRRSETNADAPRGGNAGELA